MPLQPSDTVPQATPLQAACCVSGVQMGQSHVSTLPQPSLIDEQMVFSSSQLVGTQLGVPHWFCTQA